jgi:uncharacterized OsmC-like protein
MAQSLPLSASKPLLNGFDPSAIEETIQVVTENPAAALAQFHVSSTWAGGAAAEHRVEAFELGGERIARRHTFRSDEPQAFFGGDSAANPQEYLFAAVNACMLFSYAVKAAALGIKMRHITIDTRGRLDVRGAMGLAPVAPGCETIACTVHLSADASQQQIEDLHQEVLRTSPNVYHLVSAIRLSPTLVVG